jgi:hypothetical protein
MNSRFDRRRSQPPSALTVRICRIVLDPGADWYRHPEDLQELGTAIAARLANGGQGHGVGSSLAAPIAEAVVGAIGDRMPATSSPIVQGSRR